MLQFVHFYLFLHQLLAPEEAAVSNLSRHMIFRYASGLMEGR